jgi:non-canonical purine NTP pyrophosphatase (RdgB/HAM1 family)
MADVVFITGNQGKADYLARYLEYPIEHMPLDLDEVQSLDHRKVVEHKLRQAYEKVKRPVLVEDSGVEFNALGGLPGPFTKWFEDALTLEGLCRLVDGKDRTATARCIYGFKDGDTEMYFEGTLPGKVAETPKGGRGYGFDSVFVVDGYDVTKAELSEEDYQKTYLILKPLEKVKEYLLTR